MSFKRNVTPHPFAPSHGGEYKDNKRNTVQMRRFSFFAVVDVKSEISSRRYAPPLDPSHGGDCKDNKRNTVRMRRFSFFAVVDVKSEISSRRYAPPLDPLPRRGI
ncbi:MAG: hypothetical protein LBP62_08155 [Clostridiales bacterium]|nr:hypothetical protein [Clostridiales bacterium]